MGSEHRDADPKEARVRSREFAVDSPLEGSGFEPVWGLSCQVVVLGCADSFLFGAGKAVFRPVACDQVRGARGRSQGTETVAVLSRSVLEFDGAVSGMMRIRGQAARSIGLSVSFWFR